MDPGVVRNPDFPPTVSRGLYWWCKLVVSWSSLKEVGKRERQEGCRLPTAMAVNSHQSCVGNTFLATRPTARSLQQTPRSQTEKQPRPLTRYIRVIPSSHPPKQHHLLTHICKPPPPHLNPAPAACIGSANRLQPPSIHAAVAIDETVKTQQQFPVVRVNDPPSWDLQLHPCIPPVVQPPRFSIVNHFPPCRPGPAGRISPTPCETTRDGAQTRL